MPNEIDIKEIRKALKWSRTKLAREAGVNVSTAWRWENRGVPDRGPARAFLERLAEDARQRVSA